MNDTGTLILGAAIGYSEAQVAPFLRSLRRAGYAGEVALIVEPARVAEFRQRPLFAGVTLLGARKWFPARHGLLDANGAARRSWRLIRAPVWLLLQVLDRAPLPAGLRLAAQAPLARFLLSPNESRYFHYYDFVRRHRHRRILISDVRDVVFQADPFAQLPVAGLAVSLETRAHTLGSEPWNTKWLRRAFGENAVKALADKPISCSGVTYGDRESLLAYLRAMLGELLRLRPGATSTSAIDQGIHNFLLWNGRLGTPAALETLGSAVATIGLVAEAELRLNEAGQLLNRDGTVPSVVHQYDRWPRLAERLLGGAS